MPRKSPYIIVLTDDEERHLRRTANCYSLPYSEVIRAKMILLAAQGLDNDEIGKRLDLARPVVSKWRKRFFHQRLDGLADLPRSGRPRVFSPSDRCRGEGSGLRASR